MVNELNNKEFFDHEKYLSNVKLKYLDILKRLKKWELELVDWFEADVLAEIFCFLTYCSRNDEEMEQLFFTIYDTLSSIVARMLQDIHYKEKIKNIIKNANFNTFELDLGVPFIPSHVKEDLFKNFWKDIELFWFADAPQWILKQKPHFN